MTYCVCSSKAPSKFAWWSRDKVSVMAERTKKVVERTTATDAETLPVAKTARSDDKKTRFDDDIDSILDEIDDVLEANAEDFVRNYVQKGGE